MVQEPRNDSAASSALRPSRLLAAVLATLLAAAGVLVTAAAPSAGAAVVPGATGFGQNGSAATLIVTKPVGVALNDLLLAQITFEKGVDAGTNAQITPSGWTLVNRRNQPANGTDLGQAIFYRVATAADVSASTTSYQWSFQQPVKAAGAITRYTGVDTSNPIVAAQATATSGSGGTLTAPSVNADANSRIVAFFGHKKAGIDLPTPVGMTERYEFQNPQDVRIMAADELRSTSGSTGNRTSAPSSPDKWVAQMVVVRAAPNVAPTVGEITGPASVDEGTSQSYSVSASDPDPGDVLTYVWSVTSGSATLAGTGATRTVQFPDGPGTVGLQVVVDDGHGHATTRTRSVTVTNVAPSATFVTPSSVDEGSPIPVSFASPSDPSAADTAAGFTYAFDCSTGAGFGAFSTSTSTTCATTDNGTRTVAGQIRDRDGGVREYSATVAVANVAPSGTFATNAPVDEGSPIELSFTSVTDPAPGDTAFTYAFDCGSGAYAAFGSSPTATCPTTDNGTQTVRGKVRDDEGGEREYTITSVVVNNVAPTATPTFPATVPEGSDIALSLSDPDDPGTADILTYAFDCGSGYGIASAAASTACPTDDDGDRAVAAKVVDDDGGSSEYTTTVTVTNVAPTALLTAPSSVDEGSSFTLSLTNPHDPSSVDAAALLYAFDCGDGAGFSTPSSEASAVCATSQDGQRAVAAKVIDKDDGSTEYQATVAVENVAPDVDAGADAAIDEGSTFSATGSFTDPGADPWTATVDYGDGTGLQPLALNPDQTFALEHTYVDDGTFTVTVLVHDDDGSGSDSVAVTVANLTPVVTFGGDVIDEGSEYATTGSFVDAGADEWTAVVNYGDGASEAVGLNADKTFSLSHTYADNGTYIVTVDVTDDDNATGTGTASVVVANVAPAVVAGADATVGEGGSFTQGGSFTDPGADTWAATVDYGDGSGSQALSLDADHTFSLDHAYADNGTYTVVVTVSDDDDGTGSGTLVVTVDNVAPDVNAGPDGAIVEGGTFASSGTFTDPGADIWQATVDYGDGSGVQPLTVTDMGFQLSHLYADNDLDEQYTVTVTVTDDDGGSHADTADVTVTNEGPAVDAGAPTATIEEGSTFERAGTYSDPGADEHTATVDYGDLSGSAALELAGGGFSLSHRYTDNGLYTAAVTVTDDDGDPGSDFVAVTVTNVAPVIDEIADGGATEGGTFSASGSFADPGADTWTATVDYGEGAGPEALALAADMSFDLSHMYPQDGTFSVTVTVTDDDGESDAETFDVVVTNVAPTVAAGDDASIDEGGALIGSGSITDPGADTWTATVDYGDGSDPQSLTVVGQTFALAHTYVQDGVYSVVVTVHDDDGSGTDSLTVTVANVAPTVIVTGASIDEGSPFSATASFTDPGADSWSATVDYGDGTSGPLVLAADKTFVLDHTYADDGEYTVTVTVTDDDTVGVGTATVAVQNVAPQVSAGADVTVSEGSPFVQAGSFTDPGADTWTATVDYGDGTGSQPLALTAKTFSLGHAYADNGTYTVTVTITDDDGGSGPDALTVTVDNVAPVTNAGPDATIVEGGTFDSTGSFTDPGADTWTASVDYGDGTGEQALGLESRGFELHHTYVDNDDDEVYTVTVVVTDDDGGTSTDTVEVTVDNDAPTVDAGDDATIDEGATFTRAGTYDDPGADSHTGSVDYGDGTPASALTLEPTDQSFSLSHPYLDDAGAGYTATVTVTDDDGAAGTGSVLVGVQNVAPVVDAGTDDHILEGGTFTGSGSFTDPGTDTWSATVDYGDGTSGPLLLTADKTFVLSHTYVQDGTFDVLVTVDDGDGGTDTDALTVLVDNVAPTVSAGADQTTAEGAAFAGSGSFTDPGADNWTATVDYGDGSGPEPLALTGKSFQLSHVYEQDGAYTVTVVVTDDDDSRSDSLMVTVTNVAPAVFFAGATIDEGGTYATTGSFVDPGADAWTATVDYGDGSGVQPLVLNADNTFSLDHRYVDDDADDTMTVTVRVDDDDTHGTASADVTVRNVAPTASALVVGGTGTACLAGRAISVQFTVSDPAGQHDTISGQVQWGDGTSTPYTGSSFTGTHTYGAGTFLVTATSGDEDGGVGTPVTASFGNLYTASALLPPVQADGNGTYKLGSTIPLKIHVTDCQGAAVTNLSPIVGLERVAPSYSGVDEVVSSSSADTGQTMRVTGSQYHYNLSTKRSALNANQDLTAGRYHVTVSSPAFATVHGHFNLKP